MLIGLDGGASKFSAYEICSDMTERGRELTPGPAQAKILTPKVEPVALETQLAQRQQPNLTESEKSSGTRWIQAAAKAISKVADGQTFVSLGVCMPGLKTADQRGISVILNGPRMPQFADLLEAELLHGHGICLPRPIPRLIGDGVAGALGEKFGHGGHMRDVQYAYYIAGGTGIAEAVVIDGEVKAVDAVGLDQAWKLKNKSGTCFEDLIAQKHLNARYELYSRKKRGSINDLELNAMSGDTNACRVLSDAAEAIADLILIRQREFETTLKRPFQKVVLGQHTGRMYLDPSMKSVFASVVDHAIVHRSLGNILVGSDLRSAPALGAASTAH